MEPNNRTISQLKYSGGMRLIKNFDVSDSIMKYDQNSENIKAYNEYLNNFFYDLATKQNEMLEFKIFRKYTLDEIKTLPSLKILGPPAALDTYYNQILRFASTNQSYINELNKTKQQAIILMEYLKKAYNIKPE